MMEMENRAMFSRTISGGRFALALSLVAALPLAGCVKLGSKVPDQLISLTPQAVAPAGAIGTGRFADAIVVLDPSAERRLDVQRVPVKVDAATGAYLKDATWVEKPARQFRRLLAETIRAKGGRLVLESDDYDVAGRIVLSGRLLDMGYDAQSQSVVVRYDALRENADGSVQSQRFEATVPGVAPRAGAVAPALNRAANEVAAQVAQWLGQGGLD